MEHEIMKISICGSKSKNVRKNILHHKKYLNNVLASQENIL